MASEVDSSERKEYLYCSVSDLFLQSAWKKEHVKSIKTPEYLCARLKDVAKYEL